MFLEERIQAFASLGEKLKSLTNSEFEALAVKVGNNNNWFTTANVQAAISGISEYLERSKLEHWAKSYELDKVNNPKTIGIMMAGNIPAVGFHDLLCVLISGHKAAIKLSSSDTVSITWLVDKLLEIEPRFKSMVSFEEMLKNKDAYIATGSDNSARYFDYYFGKYPHIIRKNRTSLAVLDGREGREDFINLGRDIFQYFGLGCRNVSKLFVQENFEFTQFLDAIEGYKQMADHHKYLNNYDYNKSIYLVNKEAHLDNGFLLLKESEEMVSPISVLYYEKYLDLHDLKNKLAEVSDKTQCIVSKNAWYEGSFDFGRAQCPALDDYADGVDTLEFLENL
ncbi:hypothetical protein A33Q_3107 [Indibacter alkaliphilus LW1]|uniref:Acyl-CoA reductase n=1 Tax=Indibacter alkaliphilus (strain CCUG 57479 / KCTC 22604 / LW1) TaxID=1189612 RepID=S2DFC1_INDAL|nr:acyl-CoA reductase [Indibacter alkaliphilus]EOZ95745.1 hypothetical protein A33Q_3107 [Indibacter alkaliphilus LW1]